MAPVNDKVRSGLDHAAVDLRAGARRHEDEGVGIARAGRLAGAGMRAGRAVVLAGRVDAVAFLLLLRIVRQAGCGLQRDGQADGGGESGGGEDAVHAVWSPLLWTPIPQTSP